MIRQSTAFETLVSAFIALLLTSVVSACGNGGYQLANANKRSDLGAGQGFELSLRINEVMATPRDARRGEYVEIYNDAPTAASLEGLILDDGDRHDVLHTLTGPSTIAPFSYGLIVDPDMPATELARFPKVAVYSVKDHALGNGLTTTDPITLLTEGGLVLDRVAPLETKVGFARERRAPLLDDAASSWRLREAGSPGTRNLNAPSELLRLHVTHDVDEAETIAALIAFVDATDTRLDCALYQMDHPGVIAALLAAFNRGVAVRIVTDSTFFDRTDYHQAYLPLLAAGVPVVPDERSSEQHNKFLVADGLRVWLGSYNPTTHASADSALELESAGIARELTRQVDDMMSRHFGVSKRPTLVANHLVDGAKLRLLASPKDGVRAQLVQAIAAAKHSVHFLAFSLTADAIGDALLERAAAGVEVHGAIDRLHASRHGSEWPRFLAAGLDVRRAPHAMLMHQKLIVIDGGTEDATFILGSYNFTDRAETRNDETMLIVHDPRLAVSAEAAVAALMQASAPVENPGLPALRITEAARGMSSWVELENPGAEAVSLVGLQLSNLETHAPLETSSGSASLAPGERRVFVYKAGFGGSDPVLLETATGLVIDGVASALLSGSNSSDRQTLTRVGPVSWTLAAPTPGL